ncbi:ComEC/Rec2 family competence protein [Arthrobacter agilis]|uniref:ComEC/Rec2 family competence protein n=1 Tax=Arthrobacter agilis TaxID=37921 RepID=UPI002781C0BA|nr:ComEC/Rec2 family competence protein [Arthrobacter agilis]MDQ0734941.1 ComEC/Rec2-related protein [Arthrobacter agilis]
MPSAATAWAAAAAAVIHGGAVGVTAAGLIAASVGVTLACLVALVPAGPRPAWLLVPVQVLPPVAALTLVLLAAGGSLARAEAGPVDDAVRSGARFTAVLRIAGEPSPLAPGPFGSGTRYLVEADVVGGVLRGQAFASATPVVVLGPEPWSGVGTGDTVRVLGTAKPADRVGRAAAVFLPASSPSIEEAEGWLGYTEDLRARFRDLATRDDRDGGLLPGMALGDRIGLEPDLEADMRTTGLTHLTAVSGANCSYVVAFAFLGLRTVRLPRLPAAVGAVGALICFVMLVRPEPSVLRAAVMGAIGVAAVLSGRGRVSLTLLMLSVIILLAADPWLSVSFAFMLSVAATLGLVTAGPAVVETLERVMPRILAQLLAIPLTAQLFCTPILVLIQPSLPVYALPANILASPVVPGITLLGMLAVLALIVAPVVAHPLVIAAQWGTRWVAGIADTLSAAPAASLPWLPGVPGAIVAGLVSVALLLLIRRDALVARWGRTRRASRVQADHEDTAPTPTRSCPRRPRAWILAVLGAIVCLAAVAALAGRARVPEGRSWIVTMCDVDQGDAVVVRTTPGHALVVDAGPDPEALDRCLDALRIEVIDALVITHLHDDHYGGVEGAVRGRVLSALYYSTGEDHLPREVEKAAAAAGVRAARLDSGSALHLPPLRIDVLWPPEDAAPPEENNASAVLEVVAPTTAGSITILLLGDLEEDAATSLLTATPSLSTKGVEVLKIAHHGARNGGTALLEAVHPRLALISVGEGNDYGHPHPTILDALERSRIATARTDELGTVLVDVVGDTLEARTLR